MKFDNLKFYLALDPAGPLFTTKNADSRLDQGDANFVNVMHTDMITFGIGIPVGDVDFYVNGGIFQPNCDRNNDLGK